MVNPFTPFIGLSESRPSVARRIARHVVNYSPIVVSAISRLIRGRSRDLAERQISGQEKEIYRRT
jgi:hypothetical protein